MIVRSMSAALLLGGMGACESEAPMRLPTPLARATDFDTASVRGSDNGLEVIQWLAPCDPSHAVRTLTSFGAEGTLPPETIERLRRNGFMVAEVPTDRLAAALAELGGTLADLRNWHGQVPEWRDLLRTELSRGQAIFTGGRVRAVGGGSLRLGLRGWTVPMEDGGLFWIELLPYALSRDGASLATAGPRDRVRGDPFPDAGLSVVLDTGWSLLLCPDAMESPEVVASTARPEAEPPPTLGAVLMPVERLPTVEGVPMQERTPVMVLIPRLPESLVPATSAAAPRASAAPIASAARAGAQP